MKTLLNVLSWIFLILLGLIMGLLEDIIFVAVLVPNLPMSWDLTGNMFWMFTVPLAQFMALIVVGSLAWFFLGLQRPPRLLTFALCWIIARSAFLVFAKNPVADILVYLAWIAFWCGILWYLGRIARRRASLIA